MASDVNERSDLIIGACNREDEVDDGAWRCSLSPSQCVWVMFDYVAQLGML